MMKITNSNITWEINIQAPEAVISFNGELVKETLMPLWEQQANFLEIEGVETLIFDLSQLTRLDSAGFVVLCNIFFSYESKVTLIIIGSSEHFIALAQLFDLDKWLTQYIK